MKKITLIGANGKIGRKFLSLLPLLDSKSENIEIVLINSSNELSAVRMNGFLDDLKGAFALKNINNISFKVSKDYEATKNSDIVLCCAGK